jgi:hypothetical protein
MPLDIKHPVYALYAFIPDDYNTSQYNLNLIGLGSLGTAVVKERYGGIPV